MPKNNKNGARKAKSDDDFDDMHSELRAADITISTAISSSSSIGSHDAPNAARSKMEVVEVAILDACRRGDVIHLRRWGQQGVHVMSAAPLYVSAGNGASLDVLRCLVKELGADVNGISTENGATALYYATQNAHLAIMRLLVKELARGKR
jgi:hypothetical protein